MGDPWADENGAGTYLKGRRSESEMTSVPHGRLGLSSPERRLGVAVIAMLVLAIALPAMPQDPAYHRFADTRTLWNVRNALDVLSNVSFLALGGIGLLLHLQGRLAYNSTAMRHAGAMFFLGLLLTALGSGYYHLDPTDASLAWDRLGMIVVFSGVLGLAAAHRVSARAARALLPFSITAGVLSVAWFAATGSITPYVVLQFGGIALIAGLAARPAHGTGPNWAALIAAYAFAKVLEIEDTQVLALTAGIVSGHTLKHVLAALTALAVIVPLLRATRRPG